MRRDLTMDDLGDLAELRVLAVLATSRPDGTVLLSPVWHEWRDGGFRVVTSSRNVKAAHLRRDPRASIVACERCPPYRGVEVRCRALLRSAGVRCLWGGPPHDQWQPREPSTDHPLWRGATPTFMPDRDVVVIRGLVWEEA